jgi:hypothetical protein
MMMNRRWLLCLALLACALPATASVQQRESVRYGRALLFPMKDELTDENRSYILVPGERNEETDLTLGWKCEGVGFVLMVTLGGYMGGDRNDRVVVRYRFDDGEASPEARWRLFAGNTRTHAPMEQVAELTLLARDADRVVIRVTDPLDGEVKTNTFHLDGVSRALDQLTCVPPEARPNG